MAKNNWRQLFVQSEFAKKLEASLHPALKEVDGHLKSTANTDVQHRLITLDISQAPLKCALSYAYELKNLEHADKYNALNHAAKTHEISKARYVNEVILLEAESIYFRCKVFDDISKNNASFPCNPAYIKIYNTFRNQTESEVIKKMALYIKENGIVRREYAAKKYYADMYDFYARRKKWPAHYDAPRSDSVLTLKEIKSALSDLTSKDDTNQLKNNKKI